ncbi:hypothetical protein [Hydrogenophaga sp.]|uniref:hypothetical protein n=1 Tax=Hydrogenophaga sp. TaxID=1904254 RepID=UPI00262CC3D1|nr:hypothetical protein [Hydrogenophaga sp.]
MSNGAKIVARQLGIGLHGGESSLQLRASGKAQFLHRSQLQVGQQRRIVEFHRQTLGCFQVFIALGAQAQGITIGLHDCLELFAQGRSLAQLGTEFEQGRHLGPRDFVDRPGL